MKLSIRYCFAIASLCALLATAGAQTVAFSVNTISGDSDVIPVGPGAVLFGAYTIGLSAIVNGVAFTGVTPSEGSMNLGSNMTLGSVIGIASGSSAAGGPFGSLSSAYQAILNTCAYSIEVPMTLTLNNLVVGDSYKMNFWFQYAAGAYGFNETATSGGYTSASAQWNESYYAAPGDASAAYNGVGQYIQVTLTATSSSQTFSFNGYNEYNDPITPLLTAVEVIQTPEPSTMALVAAGAGLLGIAGSRRFRFVAG